MCFMLPRQLFMKELKENRSNCHSPFIRFNDESFDCKMLDHNQIHLSQVPSGGPAVQNPNWTPEVLRGWNQRLFGVFWHKSDSKG